MENSSCPHCNASGPQVALSGPPAVRRCPACGLVFLEEFPGAEELKALYQDEYYEAESGERFFAPLEWLVSCFRSLRVRDVVRHLPAATEPRNDAVLDVGCGRGLLLRCLRERGWVVRGTQLSETAARACERRYGIPIHLGELPDLELEDASFRVVTLYHVLEHVDRPLAYLRESRRLLRDDGLLVLEVPDAGAPGFRWLGVRNFCLDYPNHLYFFTRQTLSRMAQEAGFEVVEAKHFSLEYSPFTCLQNLLNALPGQPNRLYRALQRNEAGRRLRRRPWTWVHALLGGLMALPALVVSLSGLVVPVGNTLRLYCRPRRVPERATGCWDDLARAQ